MIKYTECKNVSRKDTVVIFYVMSENSNNKYPKEFDFITPYIDSKFFENKKDFISLIPLNNHPNVIIASIENLSAGKIQKTGSAIQDVCLNNNISTIHLLMPSFNYDKTSFIISLLDSMISSNYAFNRNLTIKENIKQPISEIVLLNYIDIDRIQIQKLLIISNNINECRDLINESTNNSNPLTITALFSKISHKLRLKCSILDEKKIMQKKMNLLLAVSKGGEYPPRLAIIEYKGNPKSKEIIALIGKGVTFDTGGLNLKPSGSIETMRYDMSGAAIAFYSLKTIAELKIPINVVTVIPLCENAIDRYSYKPGDVFTSYKGLTVQVNNTDAEGRLILADALAYTEDIYSPKFMIDIATLTGACKVTFGEEYAALLSNNTELTQYLKNASSETNEKIWELPLDEAYDESLKSDFADVSNISNLKNAGTITGAAFLQKFVTEKNWAHIDIASTAWSSQKKGHKPKNATAFGIKLLTRAVELMIKK